MLIKVQVIKEGLEYHYDCQIIPGNAPNAYESLGDVCAWPLEGLRTGSHVM